MVPYGRYYVLVLAVVMRNYFTCCLLILQLASYLAVGTPENRLKL